MYSITLSTIAAALIVMGLFPAIAQPLKTGAAGERSSVDLTIYNQNLSLIREERPITLPRGMSRLVIPEIPSTIDGTSLHFLSLSDPGAVRVLEQSYQYDLVHPSKLLERYLGKEIEFVRVEPSTDKEYTVTMAAAATDNPAELEKRSYQLVDLAFTTIMRDRDFQRAF